MLRVHIIDVRNMCLVKPTINNVTPVRFFESPISKYFLALPTQQQVLATICRKLLRKPLPAITVISVDKKALDRMVRHLPKIINDSTRMVFLLPLLPTLN